LEAPLPLVATMGRAEREQAATLIVRTCVREGDTWAPVTPQQIGATIKADLEEQIDPLYSLRENPFFKPDFRDLAEHGYASCTFETGAPLELTPKAFEAIAARWVRA
jgi:hypothetical protein